MNLHAIIVFIISLIVYNNYYSRRRNSGYFGCNAKKIDSYDLLIGDWDTSIRLQHRTKLIEIFTTQAAAATTTTTTKTGTTSTISNPIITTQGVPYRNNKWLNPLQRHRVIPCRLSLYANGTFGMKDHQASSNIQSPSPSLLIRGKWTLKTNPYCVTDRFYDDIVLESFPRVQKEQQHIVVPNDAHPNHDNTNYSAKDTLSQSVSVMRPIRKVRLKLHCRLQGHFSGGNRRRTMSFRSLRSEQHHHYYARGKITHGVVTLEELYNIQDTKKSDDCDTTTAGGTLPLRFLVEQYRQQRHSNRIIASFSAKRYIPTFSDLASQSNDDEEDLDIL
jgi:hypothetical protein